MEIKVVYIENILSSRIMLFKSVSGNEHWLALPGCFHAHECIASGLSLVEKPRTIRFQEVPVWVEGYVQSAFIV